jgi:phage repressor protein C with HTH and peptisase S24 domain
MAPTIAPGDVVVAQTGGVPGDSDLVVVQMGLELSVRRLREASGRFMLAHEVVESRPVHADFDVRGRVIGLMRNLGHSVPNLT